MHFYITNDIVALYFQITEEQLNNIMIVECFWGHAYLFVFSLSAISRSPWAVLNYIIDNIDFYLFIFTDCAELIWLIWMMGLLYLMMPNLKNEGKEN